jgi:isopentenyl-diphosphate Delta-isomerase
MGLAAAPLLNTSRDAIPAIAADGTLFAAEKMDVHRSGQQHLAVSVFVFSQGRLLIQKRAAGKYHCAGQWANTCCTHPHWGESVEACARRRLREEVGLELELTPRSVIDYRAEVTNGLIENERVHVFEGELGAPVSPIFNRQEVAELRWIALGDLLREASRSPAAFTPWLRIYLQRWDELGLVGRH